MSAADVLDRAADNMPRTGTPSVIREIVSAELALGIPSTSERRAVSSLRRHLGLDDGTSLYAWASKRTADEVITALRECAVSLRGAS